MRYSEDAPNREQVDALPGAALLDFGTNWCGHCRAAAPIIAEALAAHPDVQHIKVEDGKGRPLGRSYQVKLWPTLIFLKDGEERARLLRPTDPALVTEALEKIIAR
ncbi:MAG: thioredoxin family protein [Pseudomonadales bacterium]